MLTDQHAGCADDQEDGEEAHDVLRLQQGVLQLHALAGGVEFGLQLGGQLVQAGGLLARLDPGVIALVVAHLVERFLGPALGGGQFGLHFRLPGEGGGVELVRSLQRSQAL